MLNFLKIFRVFKRGAGKAALTPSEAETAQIEVCARAYLRRWCPGVLTYWGVLGARDHRSLRTLIRCLSPRQREELLARNSFKANGYVIQCNASASNIYRNSPFVKRFCAVPVAAHGYFDIFLVQKLWVEHREQDFLQVAVKSGE